MKAPNKHIEWIDAVLSVTGVERSSLWEYTRKRSPVRARQMLAAGLRFHAKLPLKEIGRIMSRDHSTIVHALDQHRNLLFYNDYRAQWEELEPICEQIYAHSEPTYARHLTNKARIEYIIGEVYADKMTIGQGAAKLIEDLRSGKIIAPSLEKSKN